MQNGGLQKLQELKLTDVIRQSDIKENLLELISTINSYYPDEIVKYYSPENAESDNTPAKQEEKVEAGEEAMKAIDNFDSKLAEEQN